jgi:hypothetical protein
MTNNRREANFSFVDVLLMNRDGSSERHKSERFFFCLSIDRAEYKESCYSLAHRSVTFNAARKSLMREKDGDNQILMMCECDSVKLVGISLSFDFQSLQSEQWMPVPADITHDRSRGWHHQGFCLPSMDRLDRVKYPHLVNRLSPGETCGWRFLFFHRPLFACARTRQDWRRQSALERVVVPKTLLNSFANNLYCWSKSN